MDEAILAITEILVERYHPDQIILFGSQARGDADSRSDVDLLVVMPGNVDRRQAAIEMHRAVLDIPVAKDIIVTTPDELTRHGHLVGTILRSALREGRVLYARP